MWARIRVCVHAYKCTEGGSSTAVNHESVHVQEGECHIYIYIYIYMYACIHVLCNHGKPLDACINELIEYTMWLFAWKGTTNAYLMAAVGIIYMYVLTAPTSAEVHVEVLSIHVY